MTPPSAWSTAFLEHNINFYCGVPDSLLAPLSSLFDDTSFTTHVTAANEGAAVGLAIGAHLASQTIPLVYMQNSGLGNAVNPLTSLSHPDVYSIPILLVIGWRGSPGYQDEPQHIKQGAITLEQLDLLDIPYTVATEHSDPFQTVKEAVLRASRNCSPSAIVFSPGTLSQAEKASPSVTHSQITRYQAIKLIVDDLPSDTIFISTTGKISRELYQIRQTMRSTRKDFLTVGGMGHAISISQGFALTKPNSLVCCLDGDGAALMHLGSLASVGSSAPSNLLHIVLNNRCHQSVGGQSTCAPLTLFAPLAEIFGYTSAVKISALRDLTSSLHSCIPSKGPHFLEIDIDQSESPQLPRPKESPLQNKLAFLASL